jgi:outer membrane protein OmpA-like peptidoglycan-associated protein
MRVAHSMAIALAFASFSAAAEQVVGDTYVVPQFGYTQLDDDRDAKDDITYGIGIGKHFSEAVSLELAIDRGSYDIRGAGSDDLDLTALSLNALHVFARDSAVSPFLIAGVGAAHNDVENADAHTYFMTQAGLGLMIQVGERDNGARKFSFRPEIKARWTLPRDNDPQDKYLDYVAMLGFQFAFGDPRPAPAPEPAPEPTPPPALPAPPPPPPDSDGDGVTDDRDQCPDTPRGVAVDAVGCPRRGSATLQGVTFELNSANLTADSRPVLDAVAADLVKHDRLKVELQGHTDSSGADAYNMQLSERRAAAVREYLIAQGVPPTQLVSRGYGETKPIAENKTNEGRAQNRRVEMAVLENPADVDVEIEQPQ